MKTRYLVGMIVLFMFMLVVVPDFMVPLRPRLSDGAYYVITKALQAVAAIMMFMIIRMDRDDAISTGSELGHKAALGQLRNPNRDEIYQLREILASDIPGRFALSMDIIRPPQKAGEFPEIERQGLFFGAIEEEIAGIKEEFKRRGGRTAFYIHYVNGDQYVEGKKPSFCYMIYNPYRLIPGGIPASDELGEGS